MKFTYYSIYCQGKILYNSAKNVKILSIILILQVFLFFLCSHFHF